MGLSVVVSAMFSMEQKGVDVVGVEKNRPLSRSPTVADEPGGGTRRSVEGSCEGGGVEGGGGGLAVVEAVVKRAGFSASRIEATAVVDDGKRTGKMLVDTGLRSESRDKAKM